MKKKPATRDHSTKKTIAVISLIITTFLLITIILLGAILNQGRERYINEQLQSIQNDFGNMETLSLMADSYDKKMSCLAIKKQLKDLDGRLWKLGEKLEKYKSASEEFYEDEYYKKQKRVFNENQVYYYLLMRKMMKKCNLSKETILFFYKNSEECEKCEDQSFILSDINKKDDEDGKQELAIFSFDMDLNLSTINVLADYYEINKFPCIVIDEEKHCGIKGERFIMEEVCHNSTGLYVCDIYAEKFNDFNNY